MDSLQKALELFPAEARKIEDWVEAKRSQGGIGPKRAVSRHQLYARALRYAYSYCRDTQEIQAARGLLRTLREAIGYSQTDHDKVIEALIDKGWAPPPEVNLVRTDQIPRVDLKEKPGAKSDRSYQPESAETAKPVSLPEPSPEPAPEPPPPPDPLPPSPPPEAHEDPPSEGGAFLSALVEETVRSETELPSQASGSSAELGTLESQEIRDFDPLETSASMRVLRPSLWNRIRAQGMGVGLGLGLLLAGVPSALWWMNQGPRGPGAEPISQLPRPAENSEALPAFPAESPATKLYDALPSGKRDFEGGIALLKWFQKEAKKEPDKLRQALPLHSQFRGAQIHAGFAKRNEEIYRFSRFQEGHGGFQGLQLARAVEEVQEIRRPEEREHRLCHFLFRVLLAYFMDPSRYPDYASDFQELVTVLQDLLEAYPEISASGSGMVLRALGEDLRDSEVATLSRLGRGLLERL